MSRRCSRASSRSARCSAPRRRSDRLEDAGFLDGADERLRDPRLRRQLGTRQAAAALLGPQRAGERTGGAALAQHAADDVERQPLLLERANAPQAGEVRPGVNGAPARASRGGSPRAW